MYCINVAYRLSRTMYVLYVCVCVFVHAWWINNETSWLFSEFLLTETFAKTLDIILTKLQWFNKFLHWNYQVSNSETKQETWFTRFLRDFRSQNAKETPQTHTQGRLCQWGCCVKFRPRPFRPRPFPGARPFCRQRPLFSRWCTVLTV